MKKLGDRQFRSLFDVRKGMTKEMLNVQFIRGFLILILNINS